MLVILMLGMSFTIKTQAQKRQKPTAEKEKMQWFDDAKLGIFIHWGIYAVDGLSESWAFYNNYISHTDYMKQLDGFTASKYNPEKWVRLIKNSGAQYSVITTRHHDGVSLWDSKARHAITTIDEAAAQKDVLTSFVSALQKSGLKTGLYYSLPDWSHPYYDVETGTRKRYTLKKEPKRWQKYVHYYQKQLQELAKQYHPDLLWFDGDWEHSSQEWKADETLDLLREYNPDIIINSRLNGHGDYATPEQGIPVVTPDAEYWELCYTMNDSWGYQPFDQKYKTPNMIVRTLADVISMGGNLLLDIGPKEDGTIPSPQVDILEDLGRWTAKHEKAIYETQKGLDFKYYKGKSALSKDKKSLFLYLEAAKEFAKIYGLASPIKSAKILGEPQAEVAIKQNEEGNVTLHFSDAQFDKDVTVVELDFDLPIQLHSKIKKTKSNLTEILNEKKSKAAVYEIADQLHSGNNLLDDSDLTVDGEKMNLKTDKKTNPETLAWIRKNSEALYHTGKGLPSGHYSGLSALSKDKQTLYLFVEGQPTGPIALKGLKNDIYRIRIVGEGTILPHKTFNKLFWNDVPGIVYIPIPKKRLDKNLTVISVLLDAPIDLYREKVGAVESNK